MRLTRTGACCQMLTLVNLGESVDGQRLVGHNRKQPPSEATIRALKRVADGERPTQAADAEGIHASTLFRHLAKKRPRRLFLLIAPEDGGYNAWVENDRLKQVGEDAQFNTLADLQAAIPGLIAKVEPSTGAC